MTPLIPKTWWEYITEKYDSKKYCTLYVVVKSKTPLDILKKMQKLEDNYFKNYKYHFFEFVV